MEDVKQIAWLSDPGSYKGTKGVAKLKRSGYPAEFTEILPLGEKPKLQKSKKVGEISKILIPLPENITRNCFTTGTLTYISNDTGDWF